MSGSKRHFFQKRLLMITENVAVSNINIFILFLFRSCEKITRIHGEIIHVDIVGRSLSQDITGTDIGNVIEEDVDRTDVKSATCTIHTRPRRAVYFCDLSFSRVLKIDDDFWRKSIMTARRSSLDWLPGSTRVRKDVTIQSVSFYFDVLPRGPLMEQNGKLVYSKTSSFLRCTL